MPNLDDISASERLLRANPDYRVLKRVPPLNEWKFEPASSEVRRAVLVDTETTGLDQDRDEVIELALLPFEYERETGRVVAVDDVHALSALREPSLEIPPAATALNGITNEMVRGHSVDSAVINVIVEPAQLIIAHNAAFDRPMVEKLWPAFEQKHWACSFEDIDWKAQGIGTAKLDYLLYTQGWFHDGHRALSDAIATLFLLTQRLPQSKQLALTALLTSARAPLRAVRAEDTAFEQRASLKARGYRWDDGDGKRNKAWWIMTGDAEAEIAWLRSEIYGDDRQIGVVNVPPTKRYSSRLWSK
jgi:DNA polymerase III subunit epsilon